jgi:hypothetical protein
MLVAVILGAKVVEPAIHLKTPLLGPDELMLAAKTAVKAIDSGKDISRYIDKAEAAVRKVVPETGIIYLEPDIQRVSVSG